MGIRDGQTDRSSAIFDQFCRASSLRGTLNIFQQLCDEIHLDRTDYASFFPTFRSKLRSWKAVSLWNKLEKRSSHEVYVNPVPCSGHQALIIGGGPCGLRTAIELAMLGCKVVVLEKRDSFSRNNVIHLWPFVIHDLRSLGAKKFYGKFCSGSIDHISIKQVQLILTKIALLLGVEIHINTSFEDLLKPENDKGWRANVQPTDHPINLYEFDILIGADGRRNSLDGFPRKEFRGKLAIGITANFVNNNSKAEAQVEEISGLSYIYNPRFFQDLKLCSGIDLENIVYYKDETHYFVMTAKKTSLLAKGVLIQDYAEVSNLLQRENVNQTALLSFAREAAKAATNGQLPDLEFAKNSHGSNDMAMFDFTSLFAAENASRIVTKNGRSLLMALVGDSLLEPFWPTGSGCARGFLSSMDAAWMIRRWCLEVDPLEVIAERESLFQLLSQTTPDNITKDYGSITINPKSRYQKLITSYMKSHQVRHLYDDDCSLPRKININIVEPPKPQKQKYFGDYDRIMRWFQFRLKAYDSIVLIEDLSSSWYDGKGLFCILHHFHPELIELKQIHDMETDRIYQRACDLIERVYEISPRVTANEIAERSADPMRMFQYLTDVCHAMAVKHRRQHSHDNESEKRNEDLCDKRVIHRGQPHRILPMVGQKVEHKPRRPTSVMSDESKQAALDVFLQVTGGRRSKELSPDESPPSRSRVKEMQTELFYKELRDQCGSTVGDVRRRSKQPDPEVRTPTRRFSDMPLNRPGIEDLIKSMNERKEQRHLEAKAQFEKELERIRSPNQDSVKLIASAKSEKCHFCMEQVQHLEKVSAEGCLFHRSCLKCSYCRAQLSLDAYAFKFSPEGEAKFFCFQHVGMDQKLREGAIQKTKNELENVRLRNKKPPDSPDSNPERAEFTNRRRSIIEDNSWNLRDFLYSADMEEEYASPVEDELSEESESESEIESDSEDDDSCRGAFSPSRGAINNAKMSFFSQPSQPVRIDPWAFFEREMGFRLVENEEKKESSHRDPSPEWDDGDLHPEQSLHLSPQKDENFNPKEQSEEKNVPHIDLDGADFIDESASSHDHSTEDTHGHVKEMDETDETGEEDKKAPKAEEENDDSSTNSPRDEKAENLPKDIFGEVNYSFLEKYRPRSNSDDGVIYLPRNLYGDSSNTDDVIVQRVDVTTDESDGGDIPEGAVSGVEVDDLDEIVKLNEVNSEDSQGDIADEPAKNVTVEKKIEDTEKIIPAKPLDLAILEKYQIKKPERAEYLRSPLRVGSMDEAGKSVKHYSIIGRSPIRSPAKSPGTTDVNDALKLLLGGASKTQTKF